MGPPKTLAPPLPQSIHCLLNAVFLNGQIPLKSAISIENTNQQRSRYILLQWIGGVLQSADIEDEMTFLVLLVWRFTDLSLVRSLGPFLVLCELDQ